MILVQTDSIEKIFNEKIYPGEDLKTFKEIFRRDYDNVSFLTKDQDSILLNLLKDIDIRPELMYRFLATKLDELDKNFVYNIFLMCAKKMVNNKNLNIAKYFKEYDILNVLQKIINNDGTVAPSDIANFSLSIKCVSRKIERHKKKDSKENKHITSIQEAELLLQRIFMMLDTATELSVIICHTTLMIMTIVAFSNMQDNEIDVYAKEYSDISIKTYKALNDDILDLAQKRH